MASPIIRDATEIEKKDFKELQDGGSFDMIEAFRIKVVDKEKELRHLKKPFCARCAKIDFRDKIERTISEKERTVYSNDLNKFKIEMPSLEDYSKIDRFDFVKESNAMEPVSGLPGAVERKVKIGIHKDYRCKVRGCGISVFIENANIDKFKEK